MSTKEELLARRQELYTDLLANWRAAVTTVRERRLAIQTEAKEQGETFFPDVEPGEHLRSRAAYSTKVQFEAQGIHVESLVKRVEGGKKALAIIDNASWRDRWSKSGRALRAEVKRYVNEAQSLATGERELRNGSGVGPWRKVASDMQTSRASATPWRLYAEAHSIEFALRIATEICDAQLDTFNGRIVAAEEAFRGGGPADRLAARVRAAIVQGERAATDDLVQNHYYFLTRERQWGEDAVAIVADFEQRSEGLLAEFDEVEQAAFELARVEREEAYQEAASAAQERGSAFFRVPGRNDPLLPPLGAERSGRPERVVHGFDTGIDPL